MGQRSQKRHRLTTKSHTLPSSPTHSSSSSDFEFAISLSPRKSSAAAADFCPADELFYKGQLLPLHISPRISMVRTLLLSSSSASSSTTASRDSTASSSSDLLSDSSRPSSAAADDEFKRLTTNTNSTSISYHPRKPSKYFSLPKLSSVFRKEQKNTPPNSSGGAAVKRASSSAREVIFRYLKKVKPLYEKLSQKQQQQHQKMSPPPQPTPPPPSSRSAVSTPNEDIRASISHSFSGNLSYPRGRSCFSSCPSSMGSSPSHGRSGSGYGYGFGFTQTARIGSGVYNSDASSMEELQNAIQGAILHCKNSMLQNKTLVSNEI